MELPLWLITPSIPTAVKVKSSQGKSAVALGLVGLKVSPLVTTCEAEERCLLDRARRKAAERGAPARASCVMSRRPVDDDETMSIDHLRVISAVCVSQ